MNEIRRPDRPADEIARIREIVGRHPLPDFVTGFDVELGEFHDEPSMWIIFHTPGDRPADPTVRRAIIDQLMALQDAVHRDLLLEYETRYPYYEYRNTSDALPSAS